MSVAWNISPQVDIMNLMVDTDEDEDVRLHRAALTNDAATLRTLLEEPGYENWIDYRVRPYLAPPLRLAVSGDSLECVNVLLSARCDIDLEDIKGQTPLFVATSLRKAAIMRALLDAGANPEGSSKNRTSPLLIAVRDGFVEGVEILLEYGADTEPLEHLKTCIPGWPLQHAVVYAHFSSFLVMLRGGACADLKKLPRTPESKVIARLSIPHTVLKYARVSYGASYKGQRSHAWSCRNRALLQPTRQRLYSMCRPTCSTQARGFQSNANLPLPPCPIAVKL
ncbi:ankyrin repeat and SOCS box protein 12-like isoform X2 [Oratosquilla oratoria]|uniref:ankyrin repeat and SOCS box protein 12-like isoform X2 n=1 Tax=Oratosquilla oratoria TaxID=337810 RepID=UPI003F775283